MAKKAKTKKRTAAKKKAAPARKKKRAVKATAKKSAKKAVKRAVKKVTKRSAPKRKFAGPTGGPGTSRSGSVTVSVVRRLEFRRRREQLAVPAR